MSPAGTVTHMFTGIVEELGSVASRDHGRLRISATAVLDGASIGDSTAVNGCCLTIVAIGDGWWEADLSDETLERTALSSLAPEDPVNLERPVRLSDRLGGHLVQGHVDAIGEVLDPAPHLRVGASQQVLRYLVPKGSVTVDGISLTVVGVDDGSFTVAVIPHTAVVTTLGIRKAGDAVNLEIDVVAKYVERLVAPHATAPPQEATV